MQFEVAYYLFYLLLLFIYSNGLLNLHYVYNLTFSWSIYELIGKEKTSDKSFFLICFFNNV